MNHQLVIRREELSSDGLCDESLVPVLLFNVPSDEINLTSLESTQRPSTGTASGTQISHLVIEDLGRVFTIRKFN